MDGPTAIPPGYRRFELLYHEYESIDGYLTDADKLMDDHRVPLEERGALRLKLLDLLSGRQVSIIPEQPPPPQGLRVVAAPDLIVPR